MKNGVVLCLGVDMEISINLFQLHSVILQIMVHL